VTAAVAHTPVKATIAAGVIHRTCKPVNDIRRHARAAQPVYAVPATAVRVHTRLLLVLVGITVLAVSPAPAQAKETIEQCANGPTGNVDCTGNAWVTGSLNSNRSRYREGDFVPFRVTIDGLRSGDTYRLRFGYDAVYTGLHAYDYVGSYNASQRPGQSIVPCSGVAQTAGPHACGASPSTLDVPTDTDTIFPSGGQEHGVFSAWGASLGSASYVTPSRIEANTPGTVERVMEITFTAQGPVVVLAWGGHVASILDWGPGRTFAQAGSGAPFHMRLRSSASFNPGSQDLALHVDVIAPRPSPFTTAVNVDAVELGGTVIDTARLSGSPRPTGTVRFFVCFDVAGPPDCTLGGDSAGHDEVLAASGTQGISSIEFRPQAVGYYCFRAEYEPSDSALFSPAAHTNRTTECFLVTPPPTRLAVTKLCVPSTDSGLFNLLIDGVIRLANARCGEGTGPLDVLPGIHTVSESAGTGTDLADYEIAFGGDCAADGSVTVLLGESATCTITNVRPGTPTAELTVIKECVPADDTGRFDVLINSLRFADLQCGQSTGAVEVAAGTHTVAEQGGTNTSLADYTSVIGGACAADGSVTLLAGESATCTITNRLRPARLTILKLCVPATDSGRFALTINGHTAGRAVRCGGSTGAIDVTPGTHLVGELGVGGTDLAKYERVVGGDCDADGLVQIAPGESATCTITNVRRPEESKVAELTLQKVCAPSTDSGRFNLRIDGVTEQEVSCGGQLGPLVLEPGTHHVGEGAAAGIDLSGYTTVIGGACHADGSITLTAGTSATCTITNVRHGAATAVLTVVKHCQPAHDSGQFVLDIDEQEFHGIRCGQSTGPITVAAGTRLVGEVATPPAIGDNYTTEFGGDCTASGTITLAPNQDATCTVTNIRIHHPPPPPPPNDCYTVTASPPRLLVGQPGTIETRAALRGKPVQDVLVRLSGAGISRSGHTRADGVARFEVTPRALGRISVTTPRQFGCPPAKIGHIAVHGISARFTG
jgi:hypothetical protein